MNDYKLQMMWVGVFAVVKGIAYLLFMAAMIKYLWS